VSNEQIKAHLEFFGELGVDGIRRDVECARAVSGAVRRGVTSVPPEDEDRSAGGTEVYAGGTEVPPLRTEMHAGGTEVPRLRTEIPIVPVFVSQAEALAAIRVDIGEDCSRCSSSASATRTPT
jgi:hypothetical protein